MSGGTPYMAGPFVLEAIGGETECIEIAVPWRGMIKAFKFQQTSGVEADCDLEVYTKLAACPPESSMSSAGYLEHTEEMYSVFGPKTRTTSTVLAEYDKEYPYVNQDGTPSNPQRRLFVKISPAGTGAKTFELAFEILTSLLG